MPKSYFLTYFDPNPSPESHSLFFFVTQPPLPKAHFPIEITWQIPDPIQAPLVCPLVYVMAREKGREMAGEEGARTLCARYVLNRDMQTKTEDVKTQTQMKIQELLN